MKLEFGQPELERIYREIGFTAGYPLDVIAALRKRMQAIDAAPTENAMLPLRSFDMRSSEGLESEYSMRVTSEWNLVVGFHGERPRRAVVRGMVSR
jgi:plasmid maintenance system killer protein